MQMIGTNSFQSRPGNASMAEIFLENQIKQKPCHSHDNFRGDSVGEADGHSVVAEQDDRRRRKREQRKARQR